VLHPEAEAGWASLLRTRLMFKGSAAVQFLLTAIPLVYEPPATQIVSPQTTEDHVIAEKPLKASVQLRPVPAP